MRFFRLTSLAHILSLAILLAIALPFATHGGAENTTSEQSITHHVALDCQTTDADGTCSLSAVHCTSLAQIDGNLYFVELHFTPALFSLASDSSDSRHDSIATPPPRA